MSQDRYVAPLALVDLGQALVTLIRANTIFSPLFSEP